MLTTLVYGSCHQFRPVISSMQDFSLSNRIKLLVWEDALCRTHTLSQRQISKLNVSLLRAHKQAAIRPIDVLEIFFYKHILHSQTRCHYTVGVTNSLNA